MPTNVSRHLLVEPTTDAQLFDMLHGLLGIGDFDDSGDVFWFKFRMTEIQKLKAMRRKRKLSLKQMAMAGRYCYRHRITVRHSWEVCTFILPAAKEAAGNRVSEVGQQIRDAVENERSRPEPDAEWIARLLRARGDYRREVLAEWMEARDARRVP